MSNQEAAAISQEIEYERAIVPLPQASSLRNVAVVHSAYFKAVDWKFCVLSCGEAVLADSFLDNVFRTFMDRNWAVRLLLQPNSITAVEVSTAEKYMRRSCARYIFLPGFCPIGSMSRGG